MEQNKSLEQNKPVSKFNLIFRTTYFSKSDKVRKNYNILLFTTSILLFIFLILSLVMTFSFNINANYFIKDIGTDKLTTLFGTLDNYNNWSNSSSLNATFGSFSNITGGALTLADALGYSEIVTATFVLSFISVAFVLLTIIFKKQTLSSYISFGISFSLLIILITLFSVLISKGLSNDNIMNYMNLGNALKKADDKTFSNALDAISKFLQGLKA